MDKSIYNLADEEHEQEIEYERAREDEEYSNC